MSERLHRLADALVAGGAGCKAYDEVGSLSLEDLKEVWRLAQEKARAHARDGKDPQVVLGTGGSPATSHIA